MANNNAIPKIGLALGSGGAKGLAHIGVIRTLIKHNIPIDFIAGASVGSLVGALYAAHKDIDKIEQIIMDFSRTKSLQLIDLTLKGGIIKGNKAEIYLAEILKHAQFVSLQIPFAAVATDISTAKPVIFTHGNLAKAIRASIAVPAFFQPLQYNHHLLADGGLSNPIPVDIVKQMGAQVTIAVNLDSVYYDKPIEDLPALSFIPLHSVNLLRHTLAKKSVKDADVIIEPPDVYHIGFLGWSYVFDNEKASSIIKLGEEAAEKAIPHIHKAIKSYQKKQSYIRRFWNLFSPSRMKQTQ